jgi:hypothetical protein
MIWTIAISILLGISTLQDTAPQVHKQGKLAIPDDYAADFDEGRVGFVGDSYIADDGVSVIWLRENVNESPLTENGYFKGSDFWFDAGKRQFLRPQHGARFSKGIVAVAGYTACATTHYTAREIRIDDLPPNAQICMRTSEGRYASIQITGYDPGSFQLVLAYTTWEKAPLPPGRGGPRH